MQRRLLGQGALAVLSWSLFIYYWWLVSRRRLNPQTLTALAILSVLVVGVCLTTLLWIRHNQRIARRAGDRRRERSPVAMEATVDALGRRLETLGHRALTEAVYVEIDIDDARGLKRYHTLATPPEEVSR